MISKASIRNFKCLRDVQVQLERFTVFVGPNASGKTSVLEAIHSAVCAATGDPQKAFAHERHGDWVYSRRGIGDLSIRCHVMGGEFAVEATPPKGWLSPDAMQKGQWEYRITPSDAALGAVLEQTGKTSFFRLDAAALAKPSYSGDDPPRLKHTGEGLASVLAHVALNDPEAFEELTSVARKLIPRLCRIRFRKATVRKKERELVRVGSDTLTRTLTRPYQGESILFDFEHAENVPAHAVSEGTLLMLGLLTVLFGPARPRILLLDDLERGLHPVAQKQVVEAIGEFLQRFPDLQLLATTHSPYLLNYLDPEQVRITATGPDGYARCGRLIDHPKFSTWKDEMYPGETWSLFGEKWLVEREAQP